MGVPRKENEAREEITGVDGTRNTTTATGSSTNLEHGTAVRVIADGWTEQTLENWWQFIAREDIK